MIIIFETSAVNKEVTQVKYSYTYITSENLLREKESRLLK